MIITCTECATKFMVKAESFGDKPRKVRCGNCSHIWSQEPLDDEAVSLENKIIDEQNENLAAAVKAKAEGVKPSLPIVVVTKIVPKWMKAAVVLLVVLNIFSFLILNKQMIGQTGFYTMLGNYDTKNISLENSQLSTLAGDDKNLYLSWAVHNDNKAAMQVPERRVQIFDKDMKRLDKAVDNRALSVEAGQNYEFKQNKISAKGKYVMLDIGSPYELMFR